MKLFYLTLFFLTSISLRAQDSRLISIQETVEFLASDDLQGRKTGTVYSEKALDFISMKMKKACGKKLKKEKFEIVLGGKDITNATNGYVFLNHKKDSTILISAHYDHLGMGGNLSKSPGKIEVHNGADDNASGVALVIDLVGNLQKEKNHRYNYLIVFFDAHELGLHGSSIFLTYPKHLEKFKTLAAHVNFDMVGRLSAEKPVLKITNSPSLDSSLEKIISIEIAKGAVEKLSELDTQKTYAAGVPCINVSTGIHADYHKPSDDSAYINFEGIQKISDEMLRLILALRI